MFAAISPNNIIYDRSLPLKLPAILRGILLVKEEVTPQVFVISFLRFCSLKLKKLEKKNDNKTINIHKLEKKVYAASCIMKYFSYINKLANISLLCLYFHGKYPDELYF